MRIKDFFRPSRWMSFTIWLLKKILRYLDKSEIYLDRWEMEQYMFRMLTCPECVEEGKCLHCGCDTMGRMMNRTDTCSRDKWGLFMSEKVWDAYRKSNQIKFIMLAQWLTKEELNKIKKIVDNYV